MHPQFQRSIQGNPYSTVDRTRDYNKDNDKNFNLLNFEVIYAYMCNRHEGKTANLIFMFQVLPCILFAVPVCSLLAKAGLWQGCPCTECLREKPGQYITILHQASTHTETHKTEKLRTSIQSISFNSMILVHSVLREEICL